MKTMLDEALLCSIQDPSALARGVRLSAGAARSRAVVLQCLVEGLAMRAVRDPDIKPATVKPALKAIVDALLS